MRNSVELISRIRTSALGLAIIFGACHDTAQRKPKESRERSACGGDRQAVIDARVEIYGDGHVYAAPEPLRWLSLSSQRISEIDSDPVHPRDLGDASEFVSPVWDEKSWYRATCYNDCSNSTSSGPPFGIERVDRSSGLRQQLVVGRYGLGNILLAGDHIYWGLYGHGNNGGVGRILKTGGKDELLLTSDGSVYDDHVKSLRMYTHQGLLVVGRFSVAWLPDGRNELRVLRRAGSTMKTQQFIGSAVRHEGSTYLTEHGRPSEDPSGSILRVSDTGDVTSIASALMQPELVAIHGTTVFFTMGETSDIWSVPTTGGKVKLAIKASPRNGQLLQLWAHECGLILLYGLDIPSSPKTLSYVPWSDMEGAL